MRKGRLSKMLNNLAQKSYIYRKANFMDKLVSTISNIFIMTNENWMNKKECAKVKSLIASIGQTALIQHERLKSEIKVIREN